MHSILWGWYEIFNYCLCCLLDLSKVNICLYHLSQVGCSFDINPIVHQTVGQIVLNYYSYRYQCQPEVNARF